MTQTLAAMDSDDQEDCVPGPYRQVLALSNAPARVTSFIRLYERTRGEALKPRREHLPLREMAPFIADIIIIECVDEALVRYRLMGTDVVGRIGRDLTGENMLDHLPEKEAWRTGHSLSMFAKHPCGCMSVYENEYASGTRVLAETLFLPLDGGREGQHLLIGLNSSQVVVEREDFRRETMLATRWRDGAVVDIGAGLPQPETMQTLKTA